MKYTGKLCAWGQKGSNLQGRHFKELKQGQG